MNEGIETLFGRMKWWQILALPITLSYSLLMESFRRSKGLDLDGGGMPQHDDFPLSVFIMMLPWVFCGLVRQSFRKLFWHQRDYVGKTIADGKVEPVGDGDIGAILDNMVIELKRHWYGRLALYVICIMSFFRKTTRARARMVEDFSSLPWYKKVLSIPILLALGILDRYYAWKDRINTIK